MSAPVLSVQDLAVHFGAVRAVDGVTLQVDPGALVGLIGPNGAGKTTLIDAVTGFVPALGTVILEGDDVTTWPPHRRALAGVGRTWQSLELFDDISVEENIEVALGPPSLATTIRGLVAPRRAAAHATVRPLLEEFGLWQHRSRLPTELSQGQRKLLGVARAMTGQHSLLLMDEPAAGLDTAESGDFGRELRRIVDRGTSILLVDHDMALVLGVCDYIYVMDFGKVIAEGAPSAIRTDERVITAYLGEHSRQHIDEAKQALASLTAEATPS